SRSHLLAKRKTVCNLDPDDAHSPLLLREFVRDYGVRSLRSVPSPKQKTFDDPGVRAVRRLARFKNLYAKVDFIGRNEHSLPLLRPHETAQSNRRLWPRALRVGQRLSQRIVEAQDYL